VSSDDKGAGSVQTEESGKHDEMDKEFNYIKSRTVFRNVLTASTEFLRGLLLAIANMNGN
jgi:hypothetical protein